MFEIYAKEMFLLAVLFVIVSSIVEVIKQLFISFPDSWGKVFKDGFSKEVNRWLSFAIAYLVAYTFDFRFASMIFKSINGSKASLSQHLNYFIVACLLFVGAKWIYHTFNNFKKDLTGKQ